MLNGRVAEHRLGLVLGGGRPRSRSETFGPREELRAEMTVLRAELRADRAELLFKLFFGMVISNAILVILVLAVLNLA